MIRLVRFAVIALALLALGQPRVGVSPAKTPTLRTAPDTGPAPGGHADFRRADLLPYLASEHETGRSRGARAGSGGASASEDGASDDIADTAGPATNPRGGSFIVEFTEDQNLAERSFLAPLKTGPPAA